MTLKVDPRYSPLYFLENPAAFGITQREEESKTEETASRSLFRLSYRGKNSEEKRVYTIEGPFKKLENLVEGVFAYNKQFSTLLSDEKGNFFARKIELLSIEEHWKKIPKKEKEEERQFIQVLPLPSPTGGAFFLREFDYQKHSSYELAFSEAILLAEKNHISFAPYFYLPKPSIGDAV